jgi:serine/threonine protein kinase
LSDDRTSSLPLSAVIDRVVGGYRILRLIGQGGMGAVYEAVHLASGREVAVKMLLAEDNGDRFRREAGVAHLLRHPNIVEVIELVTDGDGLYLVMELVRGRSVASLIESASLPVRRSLVIMRQVLEAMAHAHAAGLIHRDLKPANIMVCDVGYDLVKLLDFGAVKLVGEAVQQLGGERLTHTGVVFGTPAYLSPDQVLGRTLDARADLYSLGVVLFEMLTGRLPFRSPDPQTVLRQHVSAPIPTLASAAPDRAWCTPALELLVRRALDKAADLRWPDAPAMIAALDAAFLSLDHLPPGT